MVVLVVVALGGWYLRAVSRLRVACPGAHWPMRRTATLAAGLALWLWLSFGPLQHYGRALFWVWVVQQLLLLLVLPLLLLGGQPVELARRVSPRGLLVRVVDSRPVRLVGNPLVGPALVPIMSFALFFGPVPGLALSHASAWTVASFVLVAIGCAIALPLMDLGARAGSVALAAALAVGVLELLTDAIPGITMRLQNRVSSDFFAHRSLHAWSMSPIADQHRAGAVLWSVAELLDLPFLVALFARWVNADSAEAAQVDVVLEAQRAARGVAADEPDTPWWLTE